mgnify:CR=1 FL=1
MDQRAVRELLNQVAQGETSVDGALQSLRALPYEELSFATLDHHRGLRTGFPEVVYCEGKMPEHTAEIVARLVERRRASAASARR